MNSLKIIQPIDEFIKEEDACSRSIQMTSCTGAVRLLSGSTFNIKGRFLNSSANHPDSSRVPANFKLSSQVGK